MFILYKRRLWAFPFFFFFFLQLTGKVAIIGPLSFTVHVWMSDLKVNQKDKERQDKGGVYNTCDEYYLKCYSTTKSRLDYRSPYQVDKIEQNRISAVAIGSSFINFVLVAFAFVTVIDVVVIGMDQIEPTSRSVWSPVIILYFVCAGLCTAFHA